MNGCIKGKIKFRMAVMILTMGHNDFKYVFEERAEEY